MNLQPKILSNAFLINGYTPAVDMILVILCILLLLLLRETFIRRSRLFLLFRTCIALLLIADLQQFLLLLYCTVFRQ